ncbi:MAG: fasciclin domain-containing protein [Mariniblastus sp.]
MRRLRFLSCLVVVALFATPTLAQQKNIVQTAVGAGSFNTLVAAVKAAGLVDTLSNSELTVFAPTDEAFAKLDPALLASLLKPENKDKLTAILTYHAVPGRVSAQAAYDLRAAKSVNGQRLNLDFQSGALKVNNSTIVKTDIGCTNGVVHVIDEVLIPGLDNIPTVATNAGTFNTLLAAVGAADLAAVLSGSGPFTVFAPTDDAFSKLPAGTVESLLEPANRQKLVNILKYHVVSGRVYDNDAVKAINASTLLGRSVKVGVSASGVTINDANVVAKNIEASNGVIHVIDSVLLPGSSMSPTEALGLLTSAIDRGVPAFNAGNPGQCAEIYRSTMNQLMETGVAGADQHTMSVISTALKNAQYSQNDTDRAWALRGGIDNLFTRMSQMKMQTQVPMTRGVIEPLSSGR